MLLSLLQQTEAAFDTHRSLQRNQVWLDTDFRLRYPGAVDVQLLLCDIVMIRGTHSCVTGCFTMLF